MREPDVGRLDPRFWKVAIVVFLGPLMAQMDSTVVNFSLSTIRDDLQSTIASAQWIVSGYLLALALVLPLNGWLVDRVGANRLFLFCFSAFTAASVLCGFARSMDQLIAARIMQGIVGGLLAPMTQMTLARAAGRQLARVMGSTAIPVLVAPLLGPIMAALVLKHASWRWLFFINLPIDLLAITLALRLLPQDAAALLKRPFDFLGFVPISPGLACMLYGLDQVYAPEHASQRDGLGMLILGFVLTVAFFLHARRAKSAALVDLRLFRISVFATASATQFLSQVSIYAGQLLIPLFLMTAGGLSARSAGWLLVPMGAGLLCSLPSMGFLTGKFGCRRVSCSGALLVFLSTLPILWMSTHAIINSGDARLPFCARRWPGRDRRAFAVGSLCRGSERAARAGGHGHEYRAAARRPDWQYGYCDRDGSRGPPPASFGGARGCVCAAHVHGCFRRTGVCTRSCRGGGQPACRCTSTPSALRRSRLKPPDGPSNHRCPACTALLIG